MALLDMGGNMRDIDHFNVNMLLTDPSDSDQYRPALAL